MMCVWKRENNEDRICRKAPTCRHRRERERERKTLREERLRDRERQ